VQTAFERLAYAVDDFLVSTDFSRRIFSLPMHAYLNESDQEKIVLTLAKRI